MKGIGNIIAKFGVCVGALSVTSLVLADSDENASRWSFSAGSAWRSRVKMETRGTARAVPATAGSAQSWDTAEPDPTTPASWAGKELFRVSVPDKFSPVLGDATYAYSATRSDVTTVAGSGFGTVNASDEDAPLGLNVQGCYDFLQGETWSVGLNLRFAGYWNMKSSGFCSVDAGTITTRQYVDTWLFLNDAPLKPIAGLSMPSDYIAGTDQVKEWTVPAAGSRAVSTRLRSDLYQIGIGPKVTWSPFVGWCDSLDWLDVYGGVEVLCNIAHSEFDADGRSTSQTDCLLGFGGNVGLVGNVTDWIGIYGQVGYEWIDSTDVSTGGFRAEVDYSSLVLSAGVQVRF